MIELQEEQLFAFQKLKDSYDTAKAYEALDRMWESWNVRFCEWSVKLI